MIYLVTYYSEYDVPDGEYILGQFTKYFTYKDEAEIYMDKINELCNYKYNYEGYRVVKITEG